MRREFGGYDPTAVDAFLARCLATPGVYRSQFPLLSGRTPAGERVTPEEIREVQFSKAVLGYPIRKVDGLLDALAETVERTTWREPEAAVNEGRALATLRVLSLVDAERRTLERPTARR